MLNCYMEGGKDMLHENTVFTCAKFALKWTKIFVSSVIWYHGKILS